MDVRIHNVTDVKEEICVYENSNFYTRTLYIKDDDGNTHSFVMFGKSETNLTTKEIKHEEFEL
jgi:hypothetical protein